jgi:zinc/manganese transport system substrate-binding protein
MISFLRSPLLWAVFFVGCTVPAALAQVKVVALHPLLGDLARQVAGKNATVVDLLKPGGDAHHFEPTAKDVAAMKGAVLILASGKGLESYLSNLRDSVPGVPVVEVGRTIPSIRVEPGQEVFYCCPEHSHGAVDPHWWHSAENMKRAARVIAEELGKVDPANKDAYKASGQAVGQQMAGFKTWAQQQLSRIPRSQRKLVTAHAAFGYFCKEYGFKSLPILGLSRQDEASPQYVAQAVKIIRDEGIRAVFPEDQANPKVLREIVKETGVAMGEPLIADGTSIGASTFAAMFQNNVNAILKALQAR